MSDTTPIEALNKLIELSQDGEQNLLSSARDVSDPELAAVLRVRAQEYRIAFGELRALVQRLGGDPATQISVAATLQRGWKNLKATLAQDRDQAILEQCARAEAYTRAVYGQTLHENLSAEAYTVVATQYQAVVKHHDRFKRRCENLRELKFRRGSQVQTWRRAPSKNLNASAQEQDDHDDHDNADAAAGVIAPRTAMPPGRKGADQHQDQDNQQDGSQHGFSPN